MSVCDLDNNLSFLKDAACTTIKTFSSTRGGRVSKSELDLDDIFGESDKDDNDFEEFLNKKIPAEIQRQGLPKADDNCQHFTSFNAANAGSSRNNTGKNPAKNFGLFLNEEILVSINT